MHFTHTQLWTDSVQQPRSGSVGIIPICITSVMCSGQTKEMHLWGCADEQGPTWEKESPQGQTPAPQVFPNTARVTAHPKSRFPEQTMLSHGLALPGHDPSQTSSTPPAQPRGPCAVEHHKHWIDAFITKPSPKPQPRAPLLMPSLFQSAFQTEM